MAKSKTERESQEVFLCLRPQQKIGHSYGSHCESWTTVCFCTWDDRGNRPLWGSIGSDRWYGDLGFYCQYEWADWNGNPKPFNTYAWKVEYMDVHSVNLREAELMHKTLQRIERIKFPIQPTSFAQYVVLVCAGLGIKRCIEDGGQVAENATGYRYRVHDLSFAQGWIEREMERIRQALYPNGEPAPVQEVA